MRKKNAKADAGLRGATSPGQPLEPPLVPADRDGPRARLTFLLALSDALRPLADPVALQREACRILAEHLGVDRAYYVELDEAAGAARVAWDFGRGGAPSLAGEHRIADFAWSVAILRRGECHVVDDTQGSPLVPPADRAACLALQIVACLGAPLIKDGRLRGALCVTDRRPRVWTPTDVALVREVGERLWSTIERARAEEALREHSARLEQQARQLRWLASELTLAEHHTREALSRTLHDDLQQQLFIASLGLRAAIQAHPGDAPLQRAQSQLAEAMNAARSLSRDIFPPVLRTEGLPTALEWLGRWAGDKVGLAVSVEADEAADPSAEDARILLFESVRELLFNAAKHARAAHVQVRLAQRPGALLQIIVSDDGAGFDPAQALNQAGDNPGLGLFSIRERLSVLGGSLVVDSAPGQGTCVTLSVPSGPAAPAGPGTPEAAAPDLASGPAGAAAPAAGPRLRILLADDHALVRDGLRQLIAPHPSLEVVGEALDGAEAVAKALALRPDVVVMDVSMPVLDGVEATRRLRAAWPQVLVYGLSTQDTGRRHPIQAAGAQAYFSKRDGAGELLEALRSEQTAREARLRAGGVPGPAQAPAPQEVSRPGRGRPGGCPDCRSAAPPGSARPGCSRRSWPPAPRTGARPGGRGRPAAARRRSGSRASPRRSGAAPRAAGRRTARCRPTAPARPAARASAPRAARSARVARPRRARR